MLGIIYAVSPEGVIGKNGTIPWRYPGDWRRFKRVTLGSTVIMGRATFESIGKALPGRRNVVVTSRPLDAEGVDRVSTLAEAVAIARSQGSDAWFVGGARIYQEAMAHADRIDVTYVPDHVGTEGAVFAPAIDETVFVPGPLVPHEDEPALTRRIYQRKATG